MTCLVCREPLGGVWGKAFVPQTGRCLECEQRVASAFAHVRSAFQSVLADGKITGEEWTGLQDLVARYGLRWEDALWYAQQETRGFTERALAFAAQDGHVEPREVEHLERVMSAFRLAGEYADAVRARVARINAIRRLRSGELPSLVAADLVLDSLEVCHARADATVVRKMARGPRHTPGHLIVTSVGLKFVAGRDGADTKWQSVMQVYRKHGAVKVGTAKSQGARVYLIEDPEWFEATIDTAARIAKRQLLVPTGEPTRHIPQAIKIAVWSRDGGKCVQCSAGDYLEFDHIIPVARGGANSEGNVQLLCRRCNLQKGDRI